MNRVCEERRLPFAADFLEVYGIVKGLLGGALYAELAARHAEARPIDYVVADKGTREEALDLLMSMIGKKKFQGRGKI